VPHNRNPLCKLGINRYLLKRFGKTCEKRLIRLCIPDADSTRKGWIEYLEKELGMSRVGGEVTEFEYQQTQAE